MAKSSPSPFSGIKLTEQTPLVDSRLDQKLFSRSTPQDVTRTSKEAEQAKEARKLKTQEVGKLFDINDNPHRKDSFLFTNKEFEALEDLKLELRRKFDFRATKNDIARCALQHLIEDYHQHKENSIVVRVLKTRTPR
jgi:hypothetical protein